MIIRCPACNTSYSFDSEPPKFCQECGQSLKDEQTTVEAPIEGGSTEIADVTIAPTSAPVVPTRGLKAGERIGNYELVNILGSGGMGVVWKAIDTKNGRHVALKRLSSSHLADQDSVTRFMREAQLASKMSHPRVTFVYSAGRLGDQPYIAMELMPGETLEDRVKNEGPLPVGEAVDKILDVIDGLEAAHQMGLIHRDVKPSNCFVDSDERIKVGDFGLSKSVISDIELTRTGTFMGTPAYAAPEQIRGEKLDHRTDIYAVGATLCNVLTGKPPFVGDAMTVTAQIVTDSPKIQGDLPRELVRILKVCLEKNPSKRYQDLGELRNALLPFAQSQDSLAAIGRRVSAYMIDAVLVAVTVTVILSCIGASLGAIARARGVPIDGLLEQISWVGPILGFIAPVTYFFLLESVAGKTIGKRWLGLKVVDHEGATPSPARVLLRVFLVPGGAGIAVVFKLLLLFLWPMSTDPIETTIRTGLDSLFSVLPLILIISPMLRRHGQEGWHEILSGTRVIAEGRRETNQLLIPNPQPTNEAEHSFSVGPYEVGHVLHQTPEATVYLGMDTQLNRNVWVHFCEGVACGPCEERIRLSRTTRQRWLDGGEHEGKRWDAFESVEGLPLQTVLASRYNVGWPEYRYAMKDIAEELHTSLGDGTLPQTLSLPQVWLDRNGHAKLIDRSLVDVVSTPVADEDPRSLADLDTILPTTNPYAAPPAESSAVGLPGSDVEKSACRLVKAVGKSISRGSALPVSAQRFLADLRKMPDNKATIKWSIEELKSLGSFLGRIDWETRVGVLGITVGFEYLLYSILSAFMYVLAYFVIPVPNPSRFFLGLAMSLVVPVVLGVIFRGGLVFHVMGIAVTNTKGRRVGPLKLVTRSFLSWLPAMALTGVWLICLIAGNVQTTNATPDAGSLAADIKGNPFIILHALLIGGLSGMAVVAGVVATLVSPTRGLQDYLIGTRLTPK